METIYPLENGNTKVFLPNDMYAIIPKDYKEPAPCSDFFVIKDYNLELDPKF